MQFFGYKHMHQKARLYGTMSMLLTYFLSILSISTHAKTLLFIVVGPHEIWRFQVTYMIYHVKDVCRPIFIIVKNVVSPRAVLLCLCTMYL